jgi:hypothetical protein
MLLVRIDGASQPPGLGHNELCERDDPVAVGVRRVEHLQQATHLAGTNQFKSISVQTNRNFSFIYITIHPRHIYNIATNNALSHQSKTIHTQIYPAQLITPSLYKL